MAKRLNNPFLDAANKKLAEERAKNDGGRHAETARRKSEEAQTAFFNEHLRPLLDQLTALSAKSVRSFQLTDMRFVNPDTNPALFLTLEYTGGAYQQNLMRGGRARGPGLKDAVTIHLVDFVDDIRFTAQVTRHDRYDAAGARHETRIVMSVDAMLGALGDFVASVAPGRIAELGGATARPDPAPKGQSQASKELWANVADILEDTFNEPPATPARPKPPQRGRRR
jgi:hypothetical protein